MKNPIKNLKISRKTVIWFSVAAVLVAGLGVFAAVASRVVKPPDVRVGSEEYVLDEDGNPILVNSADRKEGFYTFLVVGTDNGGSNTDTILIGALDSQNNKASVLSVPRDTMSNVSRAVKKINAAYAVGKIPQLKKELRNLIGFDIDRYLVIDLKGFEKIVDAIGGVDLEVPDTIDFKTGKYTGGMHYDDPAQDLHIHLTKGFQHLTGSQAIGFVRFRYGYADADLGRIKAQQQFMSAVAKKMIQPSNLVKVNEIVNIIKDNTSTDISTGEMIWLGKIGLSLNSETDVATYTLPNTPRYVHDTSYVTVNESEALALLNEHFNPYKKSLVKLNLPSVSSEDSTSSSSASKQPSSTAHPTEKNKPVNSEEPKENTKPSSSPSHSEEPQNTPVHSAVPSESSEPEHTAEQKPTETAKPSETAKPLPSPTPKEDAE